MQSGSRRPHPMRTLLILSGGALAFALAQTTLIPTLGGLTRELGTDASGVAWVLTGYLLAAAVATPLRGLFAGPLSGALGSRFGSKLALALGGVVTAAGLLMLGLDHGTQGAVLGWAIVMSTGIGLAFSAMPNLIVRAVPPTQTGEAIGFNALVRSVGASVGTQVSAAILAGSATAGSALPTDDGYSTAFLVSAGVALLAGLVALAIPPPRRPEPEPVVQPRLAEPAYARRG